MKLFWSWQADTPAATGRNFIRDALVAAIEYLGERPELLEPTERDYHGPGAAASDRDLGHAGSLTTILDKIDAASIVVADVSTAGFFPIDPRAPRPPGRPRKLINSDVAIEIGYGTGALPPGALLLVMNTHYGDDKGLPLNLRHLASPALYSLTPTATREEREAAFEVLKVQFIDALKPFSTAPVRSSAVSGGPMEFEPASHRSSPATFFARDETIAVAGETGEQPFNFPSVRVAYLRFYPQFAGGWVGPARLADVFQKRLVSPMGTDSLASCSENLHGWITYDHEGAGLITALTQGFTTGELWGATAQIFTRQAIRRLVTDQRRTQIVIPAIALERLYLQTLRSYVKVAAALGCAPPYTIVVGLVGLKESYLLVPGGLFNKGEILGPISHEAFAEKHTLESVDDTALKNLLRRVFIPFYQLFDKTRRDILTDQLITAHDLPPR
jgi:hypothetical protein